MGDINLINFFKYLFKHYIIVDILFLLMLAIIPFVGYGDTFLVESDIAYDVNQQGIFLQGIYSWNEEFNLGMPNSYFINIYNVLNVSLSKLNISPFAIKQIWFSLLLFSTGLSMYYFISVFLGKERRLSKITSAVAYMYSFYLLRMLLIASTMLISYAILPLVLGLYVMGLNKEKKHLYYAILISLVLIVLSNLNLTFIIIDAIVVAIFSLVYLFANKKVDLFNIFKFNILILFFGLLISSWWVVPQIQSTMLSQEALSGALEAETPKMYNGRSSYLETFRLIGEWGFYGQYNGVPYVSFSKYYIENMPLIISGFLLAIIAICGLLFIGKKEKRLYLLFLLVLFLPLAVGAYPLDSPGITGKIYLWCYDHIPLFSIFRNGYKSVAIISFVYAISLGYFASFSYDYFKDNFKKTNKYFYKILSIVSVFTIFSFIFINSFPLWAGSLFDDKKIKSIPEYWYEVADYLNSKPLNFRVFALPDSYFSVYSWGMPRGDIARSLINKPVIETEGKTWGYKKFTGLIHESFLNQDAFNKIVSLSNIGYVVQRNDIDWEYYKNTLSPEKIKKILSAKDNLVFEKSFGDLDLYQVKNDYFLPRIYSPNKLKYVQGDFDNFSRMIYLNKYDIRDGILLIKDKEQIKNTPSFHEAVFSVKKSNKPIQTPQLEFKQISPVKYIVNVYGASESFPLIFSESFHPGWKIYIQPKLAEKSSGKFVSEERQGTIQNQNINAGRFYDSIFKKPVLDNTHLSMNGYVNSWWIDIEELEKLGKVNKNEYDNYNFSINIEFEPQKYFYIGVIISSVTFLSCLGYLLYDWRKRRKYKNEPDGKILGKIS